MVSSDSYTSNYKLSTRKGNIKCDTIFTSEKPSSSLLVVELEGPQDAVDMFYHELADELVLYGGKNGN